MKTKLKGRVLIVEDNMVNRLVALVKLEDLGLQAVAVNDGSEALLILQLEQFDLILMDCEMPIVDGYETAQRIRAGETPWSDIPIVAMSANRLTGDDAKCKAAGMNDFLTKPLQKELLAKALLKYLPEVVFHNPGS